MKRLILAFLAALTLLAPAFAATLPATPANVVQVVTGAAKGDVVQLGAGDYSLTLWNQHKTGEVIVEPKPGAKVTASFLGLNNSTYLTVRGVHIVIGAGEQYGVQAWDHASHIKLANLKIEGSDCAHKTGVGVSFRGLGPAAAVALLNADVSCTQSGVILTDVDGGTVDGVKIHDIATDGILVGGGANIVISHNSATDFYPFEGDHPDFIQWFNGTAQVRHLKILANRFDRGKGALVQGIFGEDAEDVDIEDNVVFGAMYNGVALSRTKGFKIKRDYVQPLTTEGDLGSWITVRGDASGGEISDNATPAITIEPPGMVATNTTVTYPAAPGDNTQYDAWLKSGGHPQPEPPACPCAAPLVKRIVGLRAEVVNLQRQLDAALRRADVAARVLQPPTIQPRPAAARTARPGPRRG